MGYKNLVSSNETATGEVFGGRTRLYGVIVAAGAIAGSVVFRDGGAGGAVRFQVDTPALATAVITYNMGEGDGILFETDMHVTLTQATSVTVVRE